MSNPFDVLTKRADAADRLKALQPGVKALQRGVPVGSSPEREADKLQQVAHDFEALLVKQIFASMRSTLNKEQQSFGEGMFTGMLDEQLAQHVAESGGLGLSDALTQELRARAKVSPAAVDARPTKGEDHENRSTK
jgi:Rod binding domain-containing protein